MDWVLRSSEILGTFSKLGYKHAEGYHINESCNEGLRTILQKLSAEDKSYRPFRRSIGFGQHVQRDIIPILLASKEDNTTELLIKILVNLTIPTECIISMDSSAKTNLGRHTIFELNNLLQSTKSTFTDKNVTKVVLDHLKKNVEHSSNLSAGQITKVMSCLKLLRNVLHIPEAARPQLVPPPVPRQPAMSAAATITSSTAATISSSAATISSSAATTSSNISTLTTVQNQIIWNIFSQSIDKILIRLINIPEAESWCVDMVQLVALMYKDQQDATLHKLLDDWLKIIPTETTDEESNTSPPKKGNEDSTPVMTSEPTSDSLDTTVSGKGKKQTKGETQVGTPPAMPKVAKLQKHTKKDLKRKTSAKTPKNDVTKSSTNENCPDATKETETVDELPKKGHQENEKQVTLTRSTNENNQSPNKQTPNKQTHEKPLNSKQNPNTKPESTPRELRKKKLMRRAKANISNVQGKFNSAPTNDDISQVMKEFTVDFLLRGYNILVKTLHNQILTNHESDTDTAHFFWLISYFLKFATQLEMEMKQLDSVLSFEIVSYLTAESVNLCEQFELALKLGYNDRRPLLRRLHLIVAAMREFVQAVDMYKTQIQLDAEDQALLDALLEAICEVDELRLMFVFLLRHYNPKHQTREYLQDLVVANHKFIIFLESIIKTPSFQTDINIAAHLKLFATAEMMRQYGLVLEDFSSNGEFVNDCVFTLMHHVAGDLQNLRVLYQPSILRTFTKIWENDFVLCDDWADLIEHAINTFVKKPQYSKLATTFRLEGNSSKMKRKLEMANNNSDNSENDHETSEDSFDKYAGEPSKEKWTEEELSSLNWHYVQCEASIDIVGDIVKLLKEEAVTKSRESVLNALYKQSLITKFDFERLSEKDKGVIRCLKISSPKEIYFDEVGNLCDQLKEDGRGRFLIWLQMLLLETCFAKLYNENLRNLIVPKAHPSRSEDRNETAQTNQNENEQENSNEKDNSDVAHFALFKRKKGSTIPLVSPVVGHFLTLKQSVPVVPWSSEQAAICKDFKFLQLLHRLGFQMPVDSGKAFIRMPCVWSAEQLYELAGKVGPIDSSKLKFSVNSVTAGKPSLFTRPDRNKQQVHTKIRTQSEHRSSDMPGPTFNPDSFRPSPYEAGKVKDWLDIIRRSQQCKIPMDLKRKIVEQCTDENGEQCSDEVDEILAGGHKRFMQNNDQTASGSGQFQPFSDNAMDCRPRLAPIGNDEEDHYGAYTIYDSDDDMSFSDSASMESCRERVGRGIEDARTDIIAPATHERLKYPMFSNASTRNIYLPF